MSFSWFGIEAVDALDLRDDLVAAPGDIEAVDEVAADHAEMSAPILHVKTERRDFVAIDHDLGLRLVDLGVDDRRESEHAALHRGGLQVAWQIRESAPARRWNDDESRPGNCRRPEAPGGMTGNISMPGIAASFCCTSGRIWKTVLFRSPHGFRTIPPKPLAREGDLESEVGFRETLENLARGIGEGGGLIDRGIGRRHPRCRR